MMNSFLGLLCESCGAAGARIRITYPDSGGELLVLDRSVDAGRSHSHHRGPSSSQMPLLEPLDAVAEADAAFSAPEWEGAPPSARSGGEWGLVEPDGLRAWRFRGSMSGFRVELDLTPREPKAAFVNDRLCRASSFIGFLESLLGAERGAVPGSRAVEPSVAPFNPPFVGDALAMVELKRLVRQVSASDVTLLIDGESGTGKEVVAQNVHRLSARRGKPLVIANCLEMPHALIQSELFGHAEGAFTGASRDRAGLIESASGGTFFLDEIGEMPLSLQAALLRVLQEREIRRIGESRRRKIDVRFVFATNRDLGELVRRGRFRQDLYFRMNGVRLHVPPLRQRKADITTLASHFLKAGAGEHGVPGISFGAMRRLLAYHWPGNVRELKNEMERLLVLHGGERMVASEMLSPHIAAGGVEALGSCPEDGGGLPGAVRALERRMIRGALESCSNNRTRAAEALGITRQGLLKKIKRFGMSGSEPGIREII